MKTMIYAHRGARGSRPENTMTAFEEALRTGCEGIELDVHLTRDDQLVVIHDETVDRTTNGSGAICDMTLAELKELDAGSWFDPLYQDQKIPTLIEVLSLLSESRFTGSLNLEVKTDKYPYPHIEKILAELMQQQNLPFSYLYSSFNYYSVKALHHYDPMAEKAYVLSRSSRKLKKGVKSNFISAIHPSLEWLARNDDGKQLEKITKKIRPWTVNTRKDMELCFKHQVAGFFTDYPELALEVRQQMQVGVTS